MLPIYRWLVLATLAAPIAVAASTGKAGYVDRLEITATYDAYGGASFGDVGPYQVIAGIVHGKLDPADPANAGIVDLSLAPLDASGMVDYSTDFVILRPKNVDNAKRVLFYDVVNRGNKIATSFFNGAGANFAPGQQGNALLLRLGYTIVWSGWQGDIAQSGHGDTAAVGTRFPVAVNADGTSITGRSRDEIIPDYANVSPDANGNLLVNLSYPAASLDKSQVTFNWRPTWKTPAGMTFNSPSTPIASSDWSFLNNGTQIQFKMPAGSDLGSIFTFVYQAKDATVMGIGFAAIRDFITFLKSLE